MNRYSTHVLFLAVSALAVVVWALWAGFRQKSLNRRLTEQGAELSETKAQLQKTKQERDHFARNDDLTQIYKRAFFLQYLAKKFEDVKKAGSFFYLIILDIDHFKNINERYGHRFGDQVIWTVAQTIKSNMRPNSYIGRYGGDEFVIVIDRALTKEFYSRIQQIQSAIREIELVQDGEAISVSVSGAAVKVDPTRFENIDYVLETVEQNFAKAKTNQGDIELVE